MAYYRFSSTDPEAETVESADEPGDETTSEKAAEIASRIRAWLNKNRVPVSLFAREIIHRSQGTTSTLLNKPPEQMPKGAGGEPWLSMGKFLNSPSQQAMLVNARKGIFGIFMLLCNFFKKCVIRV